MDNFDYKKYLVENKLTAGSRLSENVDTLQWPDAIRNFITTNLSSDEKELYLVVKALEKTLESFKNEMGEFDPDFHYVNENEESITSFKSISDMNNYLKKGDYDELDGYSSKELSIINKHIKSDILDKGKTLSPSKLNSLIIKLEDKYGWY